MTCNTRTLGLAGMNETIVSHMKGFDEVILQFMQEQNIPGVQLAVSQNSQILYTQAYGISKPGALVNNSSLFQIASISKMLTAVAIMRLYEDGKLKLNDKVFGKKGILKCYCPGIDGDRRLLRITVRHLLQHSGGWDFDVIGDPIYYRHVGHEMGTDEPVDRHTLVTYMLNKKLQFTPGTKHSYCNFGYIVLSLVIEEMSKKSYEEYIQQYLSDIGIISTKVGKTRQCEADPEEVEYFAHHPDYTRESIFHDDGIVAPPYGSFCLHLAAASGGWVSTAKDLLTFLHALTGSNKIIKTSTFKLMLEKPSFARPGCYSWYGLGLEVRDGKKTWGHTGAMDGTTSCLVQDKSNYAWAFICNQWTNDTDFDNVIKYAISKVSLWNKQGVVREPIYDDVTFLENGGFVKILIPSQEIYSYFEIAKSNDFQVVWIDGFEMKSGTYFNLICTRCKVNMMTKLNMKKEELLSFEEEKQSEGFIPLHIDSYKMNDLIYYAAIFKPHNNEDSEWQIKCEVDLKDYSAIQKEMHEKGFSVAEQSVSCQDSSAFVTALFHRENQKDSCWSKTHLPRKEYEKEFDRHARFGHLLCYVKAYQHGDTVRYSAVWRRTGAYIYASSHHISKYALLNDLEHYKDNNFQTVCITGYEEDDFSNFVAVYKKDVFQ